MKKFLKSLILFFILIALGSSTEARPFDNPVESAMRKSNIPSSALVSVSFKEINSGKKHFELNPKVPMSAASVQKITTVLPVLDTLGYSYEFKTQIYKSKDNNFYLKLAADPFLSTSDLKGMIRALPTQKNNTIKSFYIDDSVLDANEWGEGWQWDNDLNPLMPRFGSYNLDGNLLRINVCPTQPGAPADISTEVFYPTAFINNVVTGDKTNVKLERKNYISPDVINADGTVSHDLAISIPINYPRRYFILRLEEILRKQKISYYGDFTRLKLPSNLTLVAETKHQMPSALDEILKNSNNMVAETVFKLAGGKYTKETGSSAAAIDMFNDYYRKNGICTDDIKIVDGSGVSKNNLITADFVTDVLVNESKKVDFKQFEDHMAIPGVGTLKDRMLYFKDRLKAKTGTLTNVSAIAGYLTLKNKKTYAFCIIVNDPKSKSADKKAFEEYVLREAFDSL